jgi:hypothetical protein
MQPRHSDVFEEYTRIALEKGLVSNAAEEDEEESSSKDKKPSKEDKKDLSTAEIFYGVKTTPTKELLEQAHPKTVVMGPSYDKFNGVVENLQQRQDMMAHIALKNPQILQSNTRYIKAHQDLVNETIKLAHFLDSKNQETLMKLADSCTESLVKEAGVPGGMKAKLLSVLGLSAAALIGSAIASQYFPASENLKLDLSALIEKLSQVINDYPETGPILAPYIKNVEAMFRNISFLDEEIAKITARSIEVESITNKKQQAVARHNLAKLIFNSKLDKEIIGKVEETKVLLDNFLSVSPQVASRLDKILKSKQSSSRWWEWVSTVGRGILLSDTEDAIKLMTAMMEKVKSYKDELDQAVKDIEFYRKYLEKPDLSKFKDQPVVSKKPSDKSDKSSKTEPSDDVEKDIDMLGM